jgi:hypothetical protein
VADRIAGQGINSHETLSRTLNRYMREFGTLVNPHEEEITGRYESIGNLNRIELTQLTVPCGSISTLREPPLQTSRSGGPDVGYLLILE